MQKDVYKNWQVMLTFIAQATDMKKTFTAFLSGIVTVAAFSFCVSSACKKATTSCFNVELQREYKNVTCPTHCNGARGCDGKVYCNSCEAAKQGIYAQ